MPRRQSWLKRLLPHIDVRPFAAADRDPAGAGADHRGIVFYARHWEAVSYRLSADVAGDIELVIDAMHKISTPAERQAVFDEVARAAELICRSGPARNCPTFPRSAPRRSKRSCRGQWEAGRPAVCDRCGEQRPVRPCRGQARRGDIADACAVQPSLYADHIHLYSLDGRFVAGPALRRRRSSCAIR